MLNTRALSRARSALADIRESNSAELQRRTAEVYLRVPRIQEIDNTLRAQMAKLVSLTIAGGNNMQQALKDLEQENLELQVNRAELMTEKGYPMDYLDDIYSCPICRDSGNTSAGMCSCLKKLYKAELTKELSSLLRSGTEAFENFNLNLYDTEPVPGSPLRPRDTMQIVFSSCKKFADNFPDVANNLLLQGGTGLGKTYISACIARSVAEKGFSVCYDTAASALGAFEQQKFARDPAQQDAAAEKVFNMLDCDLMILDDLGTEMVTSISTSALYTLINSRLIAGKRMIISTNLTVEELQSKYSQQVSSRIIGEFLRLPFVGRDIRTIKK